jgi:2-polyprenyl-3-methyl-5-hydroxy-6-metoxy-1,4-benzoquinol methylase
VTVLACRICSGPLELRYRGRSGGLTSEAFAPTNHRPGEFNDLWECRDCGTVQQQELPDGEALHDLYRGMADDAYLSEETGRREAARRLLDVVGRHVPAGTLLDVGCGHGLLLDEARRLGYEVTGLELSATAAAYARDVLGLDVREQPLETYDVAPGSFQVVVLADVLEHLPDPLAALDACERLLAPGGALCVVTPDPSSPTARAAGARWWGYLPAHTFLLPRTTLRELLEARGLVISEDEPLVRSFALGYWMRGLAERGGAVGKVVERVGRTRVGERRVSLSLGDERVLLAHKLEIARPTEPLMRPRSAEMSVHVVLPAYKAAETIQVVVESMPVEAADRALLVDDASPDDTSEVALRNGLDVLRLPANRGYGANQKVSYVRAILDGADAVVMVHADNQYDPALIAQMVKPIEAGIADVVIGSRLLEDEAIAGGMPRWKWVGNRFLTSIENLAFRRGYSEYHTGYRAFSTEFLRSIPFLRNSDGFVFDQEIFAQIVARRARVIELPIPTRYFREASTVSFTASVEYGLRTLLVLARYRIDEDRGRWPLLRRPAGQLPAPAQRRDTPIAR